MGRIRLESRYLDPREEAEAEVVPQRGREPGVAPRRGRFDAADRAMAIGMETTAPLDLFSLTLGTSRRSFVLCPPVSGRPERDPPP